MKATICEKTIMYGNTRFKTDGINWKVEMFGTYGPNCKGIPSYRFMPVEDSKVPDEVKKLA